MAKIVLTENGLKLPAINAGDEIGITVSDSVEMADDAAWRVVVLGPIRGGARAVIAVSGKLRANCRTGAISLQTTQARDLFRPLLPTDSVPARVEVIDEQSRHFIAGATTVLRNSFILWGGYAFPAQTFLSGDSFEAVRAAIAAHESRSDNPHKVTEAQLVEASGTQKKSGKYLRVFDDNPETGAYSNERLTFFGETIFKGETECGETKVEALEVTGGAIVHSVLAVFGGPFYLEDLDNPGSLYELSVRGGKLYFNNVPISSDSVRSMKA